MLAPRAVAGPQAAASGDLVLPPVDVEALLQEDEQRTKGEALRFGYPHELRITPVTHGRWRSTPHGKLWSLGVRSPGAYSLSFSFERFQIPVGAELVVRSEDGTLLRGPYTHHDPHPQGGLGVPPTPGERLLLEYFEPTGVASRGELLLSAVVHDYRDVLMISDGPQARMGCHNDVACDVGVPWRDQVRATLQVIRGSVTCSGVLLNNTARDGRQLVITAGHCGNLNNASFRFRFERPQCQMGTIVNNDVLTGSIRRAFNSNLDYQLVEIRDPIPPDFEPIFAGWDRTDVRPTRSAAIHHPRGFAKKISLDYHRPRKVGTQWLIERWDSGITESGSSGAPLFSHEGLFVGQLSGGAASCASPTDDFFGRLAPQWSQIAPLLDPMGTGAERLQSLDPNPLVLDAAAPGALHAAELDRIEPDVIPNLTPGTARNVDLFGAGFTRHTRILVDGVPIGPRSSLRSSEHLAIDVPTLDRLGTHVLRVQNDSGAQALAFEVVPTATPTIQVGSGDPGNPVFPAHGIDVRLAGVPGDRYLLVASFSNRPSNRPGRYHLDLGDQFSNLFQLGTFRLNPEGQAGTTVPISAAAAGSDLYFQALNLDFPYPLTESNLQRVHVAP